MLSNVGNITNVVVAIANVSCSNVYGSENRIKVLPFGFARYQPRLVNLIVPHLRKLPKSKLKNDWLVCDAGFVCHDFGSGVMNSKKHFLVRVGGNVNLLKKLGFAVEERTTPFIFGRMTPRERN